MPWQDKGHQCNLEMHGGVSLHVSRPRHTCTQQLMLQLADAGVSNMGPVPQGTGLSQNASQAGGSGEEQAAPRHASPEEALFHGDAFCMMSQVCCMYLLVSESIASARMHLTSHELHMDGVTHGPFSAQGILLAAFQYAHPVSTGPTCSAQNGTCPANARMRL